MNEQDIRNLLVAGLPIPFHNVGYFTPLTIKDMFMMSESTYFYYVSRLLVDKSQFEDDKELKDFSSFDLFIFFIGTDENFKRDVFIALEMFFNKKPHIHYTRGGGFIYFDNAHEYIDDTIFSDLQHLIKLANFLSIEKEEEYNFANEQARKMWEKIKSNRKKKPQPKKDMDLHSLYSSISCRFEDYNKVKDFTIYQLYDAYQRLNNIDNVQYTVQGMYSGAVDGKKIKNSELNWAKIIDNK